MSGASGGGAPTAPGGGDGSWLPSRDELVGAWARAVLQLWDLTLSWWKLIPEQGEAEDERLRAWSTWVFYPSRPDRDTRLGWSGLRTPGGDTVPAAAVHVEPTAVALGPGNVRLRIAVDRPAAQRAFHYHLTIFDRDAPDDPSCRREYGLGFGVPGAGT
ncbi:MAG: hypothetical protein ACRD07_10380 [Acidimicrobiales bacterium]